MRRVYTILVGLLLLPAWLLSQSCGRSDTLLVANNSSGTFTLNITDFFNNDLADPMQGLCGVELHFVHQFSERLTLSLSSPSGQTISLMGPQSDDQFAFTFGARWRITFVPAGTAAMPDVGYLPQWNNQTQPNNFVLGGQYNGSYYPHNGSLENFNTGPVNGTWTFNYNNNPSNYAGAFFFVRLIFCDSRGVDCCFANPGQLLQPDLLACQGADTLLLGTPPPTITGMRADTSEFDYTYIIGRSDTLLAYADTVDLRSYPPGNYEVCGFSYRRSERDSFPLPDGTRRLSSLRDNLAGLVPDFCALISDSCYQVRVTAPPPVTMLSSVICPGDSVVVGTQAFRDAGQYSVLLRGIADCDSLVVLDLEVPPTPITLLTRTICEGESLAVGSSIYTASGNYENTLSTALLGCDSLVRLALTVVQPIITNLSPTICAGNTFSVGDSLFSAPGNYTVALRSSIDCDSIVNITLNVLSPVASIAIPDTITCYNNGVTLDGSASTPSGALAYAWRDVAGTPLGNATTLSVTIPAPYILTVTQTANGTSCAVSDTTVVVEDRLPPSADAGLPDTLTCDRTEIILGGTGTDTGPGFTYLWAASGGGNLLSAPDDRQVLVDAAGTYTLTVTRLSNGCTASSAVLISIDTLLPSLSIALPAAVSCAVPMVELTGTGDAGTDGLGYQWSGPCLAGTSTEPAAQAACSGLYTLQATNLRTMCTASATALVAVDSLAPSIVLPPADTLTCTQAAVLLDASASLPSGQLSFSWSGAGLTGPNDAPTAQAIAPGDYTLSLTDTANGCTASATLSVAQDTLAPQADAGTLLQIDCYQPFVVLGGSGTSIGSSFAYTWEVVSNGTLAGPIDGPTAQTETPGLYRLIVTDLRNGCADSSFVSVVDNGASPFVNIRTTEAELSCVVRSTTLDGSLPPPPANYLSDWTGPCADADPGELSVEVDCPGTYILSITNLDNGCVGTDTLVITSQPETPFAVVVDTAFLSCQTGTVQLNATGSSAGLYQWFFEDELVFNFITLTPTASQPGVYTLVVGTIDASCTDTAQIVVLQACAPQVQIATPAVITCTNSIVTLSASVSPPANYSYQWTGPQGNCFSGSSSEAAVQVFCGGEYQLIVTNPVLQTADTSYVTVLTDSNLPIANAGPNDTLNCAVQSLVLSGAGSSAGPNIAYEWFNLAGDLLATTQNITITTPDVYTLEVLDMNTNCRSVDVVQVLEFDTPPTINFGSTVFPCDAETFVLQSFVGPFAAFNQYAWTGDGIVADAEAAGVLIDAPGTYTLSVTNSLSQCSSSSTVAVGEQTCLPCIQAAPADTITCTVASVPLSAAFCNECIGCTVLWTSSDGLIAGDPTTLSVTAQRGGTYTLTATDTLGFSSTATLVVAEQTTLPDAEAGEEGLIDCNTPTATIGTPANPAWQYQWTSLNGNPVVPNDQAQITVSAADTYTLTVLNPLTGCQNTDIVNVSVDTLRPIANAGPQMSFTCAVSLVVLDGTGSSLTGPLVYTWSTSSPGNCITGAGTLNPVVSCTGTYLLSVLNTQNGCRDSSSTTVVQTNAPPSIAPIPNVDLICADTVLTLTGNAPAPTGFSARWCALDGNGMATNCDAGSTLDVTLPGNYRYELTELATGCSSSFTVTVGTNQERPDINAGASSTLSCSVDALQLNASVAAPTPPYQVQWSSSAGTIDDPNTLTPTIYAAGTYFLTVTNPLNQCSSTDSVLVLQDLNAPTASAGIDTSLTCLRLQLRLAGVGTSTSGTPSYLWTSPDGNIVQDADTPTALIDAPGTYILQVRDLQNNCLATDTVRVTEDTTPPLPSVANIDSLQLTCLVDAVTLDAAPSTTATGTNDLSYQWQLLQGGSIAGDATSVVVQATAPGLYQLLVADNATGCRDSLPFSVAGLFSAPAVQIAAPQPLTCVADTVTIDATASAFAPGYTVQWTAPNGTPLPDTTLLLSVSEPGTYTLRLTNTAGCDSTSTVTVGDLREQPIVDILMAAPLSCAAPSTVLNGSGSASGPGITYQWSGPIGAPITAGNAAIAQATAPGWYYLLVTNQNNNCSATDSLLVTQESAPITGVGLSTLPPDCTGAPIGAIAVDSVFGGEAPFLFSFEGGTFAPFRAFGNLYPGTYDLRVQDSNGCFWDEAISLTPPDSLLIDLGEDIYIQLGETVELEATIVGNYVALVWQPAGDTPAELTQRVSPVQTTTYKLVAEDEGGCLYSDVVTVWVDKQRRVFIPNAFSPNGDGINDLLVVYAGKDVAELRRFSIFDRWGNMVFDRAGVPANNPAFGWDGRFEGRPMNAGVYVLVADIAFVDGKVERLTAEVMLMR